MKNVTELKSLGDIRTAISARLPTRGPKKETAHLNLYLLDMERQRLEKELYMIERRRKRITNRLAEIGSAMEALAAAKEPENQVSPALTNPAQSRQVGASGAAGQRRWQKMSVDY